ncbi:hypothetical protein CRE_17995 [Caenorhabditis remanei]|uniref:Uncharacterized protein n=1 Tax=Caenorhabditis remanei TaxID=31234 RepID=E3MDE5_CAERE|nr:hypothetical protein CRE_17995 [Caenorhabditis remanei]
MQFVLFLFGLTSLFGYVSSRTLTDLVCKINPSRCEDFKTSGGSRRKEAEPHRGHHHIHESPLGAPSLEEFRRWNNYEEEAQGTGFLKPASGSNPVPYGQGLGDIGIYTGVGVQHPFGGLEIERNFGIGMGGNGRIGGIPVGWGNGGTRSVGSAPWANP